jgi:hypothetical protein
MHIKHLMQQFIYRIEAKPEGGFIARPADPSAPILEASTREELQQKIQANLVAALSETFPGLKFPLEKGRVNFEVHVGRKPEGGFAIHSAQIGTPVIGVVTHERVDHFAEELLSFLEKHFPDLSQAMIASAVSWDSKILTTQNTGSQFGGPQGLAPGHVVPSRYRNVEAGSVGEANTGDPIFKIGDGIAHTPITPQTSSNWPIFQFLLTLLVIAAAMYFYLHRR